MAAKPPKPPENLRLSALSTEDSTDPSKCLQQKKSDCSCTNISIMQLFHEMKQEFPTVPDHVVNQCVIDNCHDREKCVKSLNNELAAHPITAQAYPSHVLRNNQNFINKKPLTPTRPAPTSPRPNCDSKQDVILTPNQNKEIISGEHIESASKKLSDMRPQTSECDNNKPSLPPQRPTTLNFREQNYPPLSGDKNARPIHRPVRTAPPPPTMKHPPSNVQNFCSTTIQSPVSFSDSGESEISVNISLSPNSDPYKGPPTRHISSISVQPEPPYSRDFTPQSPRSFTSLNLTLRKPSATPQSPIDITAGPGLTYSSSSFDARRGYQKNFHITVSDGGNTISASRIRPRSCYNIPAEQPEREFSDYSDQDMNSRIGASMPNVARDIESVQKSTVKYKHSEAEIIERQRNVKIRLKTELDNEKRKLERIQREVKVLMSPIPLGGSTRLDNEIQRLRCDCTKIYQDIEQAGEFDLTQTDVDFYDNIYTGQRLPTQQRSTRPLSPPHIPPQISTEQYPQFSSANPRGLNPDYSDDYSNPNNAEGGPPWTCNMCTFQNHPLLNKCEQCEMARISPGTVKVISSNYIPTSFSSAMPNNRNSVNNNNIPSNNNLTNAINPTITSNENFAMPGNSSGTIMPTMPQAS